MDSSHPDRQSFTDDLPEPDTVRRLVRGQVARYALSEYLAWSQVLDAAERLRVELSSDDLLVIAHPGSHPHPSPSLTVRRLIGVDDALRLRGRLETLVAEYRTLAHRLAGLYRLHIEPVYERGEEPRNPLEVAGEAWWWHDHGEHCLFADQDSDTEIEVNTYRPAAIDPYFLLLYAESTDRYGDIHTACLEGIHDMDRLLELAAISLIPSDPHIAG